MYSGSLMYLAEFLFAFATRWLDIVKFRHKQVILFHSTVGRSQLLHLCF